MTGRYLECDFCRKHKDMGSRYIPPHDPDCERDFWQEAAAEGWIPEGKLPTQDDLWFCCQEHKDQFHAQSYT